MQLHGQNRMPQRPRKKRYARKIYYWRIAFFVSLVCAIVLVASYFLIPKVVVEGSFSISPQRYFFLVTSTHSNYHSASLASAQSKGQGRAGFVIHHNDSFLVVSQTFDSEFSATFALAQSRNSRLHQVSTSNLTFNESDISLYRFIQYPTLLYTNISSLQSDFALHQISSEAVLLSIENQAIILRDKFDELSDIDSPSHIRELYINLYKAFKEFKKLSNTYSICSALKNLQANIAFNYLLLFVQ